MAAGAAGRAGVAAGVAEGPVKYTLAQVVLVGMLVWLPFAFVRGLKLGSFTRGVRSASLRLGFVLVVAFLVTVNWQAAAPATRHRLVGWLVLAVLVGLVARSPGRGGIIGNRGRGLVDRVVGRGRGGVVRSGGRGHAPTVPRQGGGMVVGPRPFNAGGVTYVPVVAERGRRAVVGVGRRVGRGTRRLEVVGGTAYRNVREGRPPWRRRFTVRYLEAGAWLERQPWLRHRRQVDELYEDVERGQPGRVWRQRRGRWLETSRLRRDFDRDGRGR